MEDDLPIEMRILKYTRAFYCEARPLEMLPPSPDTLPGLLGVDKQVVANAIYALVESGMVTLATFQNRLELTPKGYITLKSRFGNNKSNGGQDTW